LECSISDQALPNENVTVPPYLVNQTQVSPPQVGDLDLSEVGMATSLCWSFSGMESMTNPLPQPSLAPEYNLGSFFDTHGSY
jgi:hypothetical protein